MKSWEGKSAPWRQRLDREIGLQIEAVLTPQQSQTLKDYAFPRYAIGFLYNAQRGQETGFRCEQEAELRRVARERLARFQEVWIDRARKEWELLTSEQQAAMPALVKRQGPTSAVLSVAWELGFDYDRLVPSHPMLAETPVRQRLGLSAEQESQLDAFVAETAARRGSQLQAMQSHGAQPPPSASDWDAVSKKRVEAILSPQQLAALKGTGEPVPKPYRHRQQSRNLFGRQRKNKDAAGVPPRPASAIIADLSCSSAQNAAVCCAFTFTLCSAISVNR